MISDTVGLRAQQGAKLGAISLVSYAIIVPLLLAQRDPRHLQTAGMMAMGTPLMAIYGGIAGGIIGTAVGAIEEVYNFTKPAVVGVASAFFQPPTLPSAASPTPAAEH